MKKAPPNSSSRSSSNEPQPTAPRGAAVASSSQRNESGNNSNLTPMSEATPAARSPPIIGLENHPASYASTGAQTAAAHKEMDDTIMNVKKKPESTEADDEAPMTAAQIASQWEAMEMTKDDADATKKRNRRGCIFLGMGLIIGAATATTVAIVGSGNSTGNDEGRNEYAGLSPSTMEPSQSAAPSQIPSLRPTLHPSQSDAPSPNPSLPPTLQPSSAEFEFNQTISFSLPIPSLQPSTSFSPSQIPSSIPSLQPSTSSSPSQSLGPSIQPSTSSPPSIYWPPSDYWSSFNWTQSDLSIRGEEVDDSFGYSIALSADGMTLAIGAPVSNSGMSPPPCDDRRPGYVKVYRREYEGSSWELGDTITGEESCDEFGRSVALSGNGKSLAIGATQGGTDKPGYVKVYSWDEAALNYKHLGQSIIGEAASDQFGISVSLSGDGKTLAIGARISGQAKVYGWDEAASDYKQLGQSISGNGQPTLSLSFDGKILFVGRYPSDSVKVYGWDGDDSRWRALGQPIIGEAGYSGMFGFSISNSVDGKIVVIGDPHNNANGANSGKVKVYGWDEAALDYKQLGQSISGELFEKVGETVALSGDGKTLAIGAMDNSDYGGKSGQVNVYGWDEDASNYKQLGQPINGEASFDQLGRSMSLSNDGKTLAIGAGSSSRRGYVNIFNIEYRIMSPPTNSTSTSSACYLVEVEIAFGEFPIGAGWKISLLDEGENIEVSSFFPADASLANGIDVQSLCLERGKYKLVIIDFNNNSGVQNYNIESNGETIAQGGEVGFAEETIFDIPLVP